MNWLTAQAGGREYPTILFLFKGYESLLQLFFRKARIPVPLHIPYFGKEESPPSLEAEKAKEEFA